jgi:hypothetical protein
MLGIARIDTEFVAGANMDFSQQCESVDVQEALIEWKRERLAQVKRVVLMLPPGRIGRQNSSAFTSAS